MEKERLLELAGMPLNEDGGTIRTRELDINEISKKYEFVVKPDYSIDVYLTGRKKLVGSFDSFDALLDTGLGD